MLYKRLRQDPFPGVSMDQGVQFPWYSSVYTNNPNTAGYQPALRYGDYWEQTPGNLFQYARLDVSGPLPSLLSAGVLLTDSAPGTDTVAALLTNAAGLVYGITLTGGGLTANAEVGNYLFMADNGLIRQIKSNTAGNLIFSLTDTIPGGLDVEALPAGTPGLGTDIIIYRPGHVMINTTPTAPVGVLLNDVTEGANIVMQIRGLATVLGTNTGAALVAETPAIVAASGLVTGGTPLPGTQGDAVIIPQYAYNAAPVIRVPVQFKAAGL